MPKQEQKLTGHCPKCGPGILATVKAEYKDEWDDADDDGPIGLWSYKYFRTLKCDGCSTTYIQTASFFCENDYEQWYERGTGKTMSKPIETIEYWPKPQHRQVPDWLPFLRAKDADLENLVRETFSAINSGNLVLAAIGIRTAFDRASEILGLDPSEFHTFESKLEELRKRGILSENDNLAFSILIDAGSAAAHRGWKPTQVNVDSLVSHLELFLNRNLILADNLLSLKHTIPPKPQRIKKQKKKEN